MRSRIVFLSIVSLALLAAIPATAAGGASPTVRADFSASSNIWRVRPMEPLWPIGESAGDLSNAVPSCACPGGTPENEPDCGIPGGVSNDTVDGGCNFEPNLFFPIACGETICGTAGNSASGNRDTDWYVLILPLPSDVEVRLTSEFPSPNPGILHTGGGPPVCESLELWNFSTTTCVEGSITQSLSAGNWWIFVSPEFGPGVSCGAPYTLTVICSLIFAHDFESGDVCPWSALPGAVNTCLSCGNTVVEAGEECDDGNLSNDDGCSSTCQIEYCGDGIQQAGEWCDDGDGGGDGCDENCEIDSCVGYCGFEPPGTPACYCDPECVTTFFDCCYDACPVCGLCYPTFSGAMSREESTAERERPLR